MKKIVSILVFSLLITSCFFGTNSLAYEDGSGLSYDITIPDQVIYNQWTPITINVKYKEKPLDDVIVRVRYQHERHKNIQQTITLRKTKAPGQYKTFILFPNKGNYIFDHWVETKKVYLGVTQNLLVS